MNKHTIRLELSFGARSLRVLLTAAMVFSVATEVASESVSLTTYYPAPSGVYTQLIGTSNTYLARDAGYLDVGTNAVPSAGTKMAVMNGNVGIGTTNPIRALSEVGEFLIVPDAVNGPNGIINVSDATGSNGASDNLVIRGLVANGAAGANLGIASIMANTTLMSGNVGIGFGSSIPSPASTLSVNGGIQLGDDTSACIPAKAGTQRWESGQVQVCNGTAWGAASQAPSGTIGGTCEVCPGSPWNGGCYIPVWPVLTCGWASCGSTCNVPSSCAAGWSLVLEDSPIIWSWAPGVDIRYRCIKN